MDALSSTYLQSSIQKTLSPKCFRRLKVMKLRYCCNLTITPDFSEITNLEELSLEGCVNLVSIHPSIGILKRLVVLNLRDCERLQNFPTRVEMDALQVLNLTGCLKVDQLPEALGRIKSLTELHIDRTAITELPSFVSSLINLESLSFGRYESIQPSIIRSVSLEGLHMLKCLNLSYCNLEHVPESIGGLSCLQTLDLKGNNLLEVPESIGGLSCLRTLNLKGNNLLEVPESIGGLSCLETLYLQGNNLTSFPGSFSQLSSLIWLYVNGCNKLEVLPELPHSLEFLYASNCTSLREVSGLSKDTFRYNDFRNCPKLFKNVTIDSEGSVSKTQRLDSSITSQVFIHQLYALLRYMGFRTNKGYEFFLQDRGYSKLDIVYHGNSMPEWFTNTSTGNHVKVELPSDWCYDKFWGYRTCVVFKFKKSCDIVEGYSVSNFDGASLNDFYFPFYIKLYLQNVIGIQDSYMIWLHYAWDISEWEEVKNFVTFCFFENNEDIEVKECGVRLICDEDLETVLSNLQGLPTPTQNGGMFGLRGSATSFTSLYWSW